MITSIDVGLHGLRTAVQTLTSSADDPLIGGTAVGTAAFWACALDEQFRTTPGYDDRRDADDDGRVLPGVRLLRNAVTHGAVVTTERSNGLVAPLVSPMTSRSLVYRPLADVLESWEGDRWSGRENATQDAIYSSRVAHMRTFVPLGAALRWLEAEASARNVNDEERPAPSKEGRGGS